jgi:glycosyltransferase involved in cell wall biosynthesis
MATQNKIKIRIKKISNQSTNQQKITFFIPGTIKFPLREGIRKELFWHAINMKKEGYNVEIMCFHKRQDFLKPPKLEIFNDIPVRSISHLSLPFVKFDILHIFGFLNRYSLSLLLRKRYNKAFMTVFDGGLHNFNSSLLRNKLYLRLIGKFTTKLIVQTKFQKMLLKGSIKQKKISILPPLFPDNFKQLENKSKFPSLLFMSSIIPQTGLDKILSFFPDLVKLYPNITLTVADSGHYGSDKEIFHALKKLKMQFPENIILKKVINPEIELSKAWIYLYPFQNPSDTFSVPISLFEATKTNTLFLSSNIGGVSEYFNPLFLVNPKSKAEIKAKLLFLLENYKNLGKQPLFNTNIDNKKVVNMLKSCYSINGGD